MRVVGLDLETVGQYVASWIGQRFKHKTDRFWVQVLILEWVTQCDRFLFPISNTVEVNHVGAFKTVAFRLVRSQFYLWRQSDFNFHVVLEVIWLEIEGVIRCT